MSLGSSLEIFEIFQSPLWIFQVTFLIVRQRVHLLVFSRQLSTNNFQRKSKLEVSVLLDTEHIYSDFVWKLTTCNVSYHQCCKRDSSCRVFQVFQNLQMFQIISKSLRVCHCLDFKVDHSQKITFGENILRYSGENWMKNSPAENLGMASNV